MRAIIAGGGNVGRHLAVDLMERGHEVTLIEQDPIPLAKAERTAKNVRAILGDACELWVLERAEIKGTDVVVAATGYRRGLERLVGNLGVLDERGRPITSGAESPDALSGLYFAGYTNPLSGNLRELGIHARQIADQIATSPRSAQQRARPTADLDPHSAPHNESESRFLNSTQGSVNRKASQSKAAR